MCCSTLFGLLWWFCLGYGSAYWFIISLMPWKPTPGIHDLGLHPYVSPLHLSPKTHLHFQLFSLSTYTPFPLLFHLSHPSPCPCTCQVPASAASIWPASVRYLWVLQVSVNYLWVLTSICKISVSAANICEVSVSTDKYLSGICQCCKYLTSIFYLMGPLGGFPWGGP